MVRVVGCVSGGVGRWGVRDNRSIHNVQIRGDFIEGRARSRLLEILEFTSGRHTPRLLGLPAASLAEMGRPIRWVYTIDRRRIVVEFVRPFSLVRGGLLGLCCWLRV